MIQAWIQLTLRGEVGFNDQRLLAGDGVAISEETQLEVIGIAPAEVMLFDLE